MHEYQKRSNSSPNLAALQAYRRKIAAQQASSNEGGQEEQPLPKMNRELMYKAYQARLLQFFPSQQEKESDCAPSLSTSDVAQTALDEPNLHGMMSKELMQATGQQTDVEATLTQADAETEEVQQEVQAKGDWQQKADTDTIFSNGSALQPAVMAKYENLMPGVSLEHVSLHQGRQVDAALGAAKLHGLTDGTNIAVSSKAPQGTLEHEIGHVGQRQEKGFSLNEVNRQAHEVDADRISAKLLSDRPVERFEQEKPVAKEAPDGRDSTNSEHQDTSTRSIDDRNITAKQPGVTIGKLTQEELSAGEMRQKFDRTLASGTEEETSAEKHSTQFDKDADGKGKNDTNLAQNTKSGYGSPAPSPPPTSRTNPQAIIEIHVFIKLVKDVEKAYPSDSPEKTVTRIRNLYYSSASLGFRGLLFNAPNDEFISGGFGQFANILRTVSRGDVGNATYEHLTAQANENTVRGKPQGDNPSPYIRLQNGKLVDVGHLLLTLDALLHPGSTRPYTDYGVPTIDAASWVADLALASVWVTTHLKTGKPNTQAPKNMKLSNPPTTSELDEYYKASAPESDLLGDVDGFGMRDNWNSNQPLSEALGDYYVGTQEKPAGVNKRWLTFCRLNRFVTVQGDRVKWRLRPELLGELIPRMNNFCNLFGAGTEGTKKTLLEGWHNNQKWLYIPYMLNKFLDYVASNLNAELKSKV